MRRLFLLAALLSASTASAQDARRQYLQFATGLNSAAAEFRQTVTGPNGEKVQSAQGVMEMRAPDRFRWEYRAPSPQLIVADGRKVWIYDPELRQVTVKPQDAMNQDNPLSALLRPETVERFYRVSELPARQGLQWLQLLPVRKADSPFDKAELGFRDGALRSMRLFDAMGQVSEFNFGTWRRNAAIAETRFRFKPPKGVDVVE